ncbi:MAG: hypothetical protein ACREXK_08520 [Gammaproteobacteria bacterium]
MLDRARVHVDQFPDVPVKVLEAVTGPPRQAQALLDTRSGLHAA